MNVYALLDISGTIINRIVLDDAHDFAPREGQELVVEGDQTFAIGGTIIGGSYTPPPPPPTRPLPPGPAIETVVPQDLMAQFTPNDITSIIAAIAADAQFALLWYSLLAQRDPMLVTNDRFKTGWSALISVLGQNRMNAIASALGLTITV